MIAKEHNLYHIIMINIIFIKGTKQSFVDFINRGLKGCNSKVRISADMSGGQIADRLNGHGCPITMQSYQPIGCAENAPLDLWKLKNEADEELCLSFQLIDAHKDPTPFLRYINDMDGIVLYAYGFDSPFYSSWYQYDGRKDEVSRKDASDDPKFEKYKEALKTQPDYNPNTVEAEAAYKVLEGYVQDFLKELDQD